MKNKKRTRLEVYHRYDCSARHFCCNGRCFLEYGRKAGTDGQGGRAERGEANAISAIYIETGEFLKTVEFCGSEIMELFSAQTYWQRAFTIKRKN